MYEIQGDVATANTPRLVFDADSDDTDVPAFLKKGKINGKRPTFAVLDEFAEVVEPEAPIAVAEPMEETVAIVVPESVKPADYRDEGTEVLKFVAASPIKPTDLGGLSVEELRKQEEAIQKAILEKQKAERADVISQIVEVVNTYKIPIEELVEALGGLKIKRKGVKANLKYQDPVTGATWAGRGKEPSWIKGKDRTPFLIP